jgi:hypothetical protein
MLIGAEDLVSIDAGRARVVAAPFLSWRDSVVIDVAGITCAVHFDDSEAAAMFRLRYTDLLSLGATPERHAFAMRDPEQGWLFWSGTLPVLRWPHGDLAAHAVAFLADAVALTAFFQDRDDGLVSLHAASLGLPNGVAAIIGDSNAGKTTTAIACARAQMDLYSDERCLIDHRSYVHAFPRAINIRSSGLQLLVRDRLPGADPIGVRLRAHAGGDWNDVRISDLMRGQRTLEPRPLRAVFLLGEHAPAPILQSVPPAQAVRAAARWAQGAGSGLNKIAHLLDVFGAVPCYRLHLGTPSASAQLIRSLMESFTPAFEHSR